MVAYILFRAARFVYEHDARMNKFFNRGERRVTNFLSQYCEMLFILPLAILTGMFGFAYFMIGIFLTFYSFFLGLSLVFAEHERLLDSPCNFILGHWLLGFACLGLMQIFVAHCLDCSNRVLSRMRLVLETLVGLTQVYWVAIRGYWNMLVLLPSQHDSANKKYVSACATPGLFAWFKFTVEFELLGGLVLVMASITLLALSTRIILAIIHLEKREEGTARERQNLV